jgi:uncharacterized protein YjbI with pentapeptide repeats
MTMSRLTGWCSGVTGRPSRGGSRALATLTVAAAALTGCSSALAATTPGPTGPSHLFSIPSASGSLTGANDQHLTLRLTGTRDYLARFNNRPLRQASVISSVAFARRFTHSFGSSRSNAVLTYTQPGGQIPVSIVLAIGKPRWDARHHSWTFSARWIHKQTDNALASTIYGTPPRSPTPRSFTHATLLIDDSEDCAHGGFQPYADCEGADLAFVDVTGADLTGVNFTGANLTDANLTGADLTGVNFAGADLAGVQFTGADLTGSDLAGEDLSGEIFIGADLADVDLTGADLTGAVLPGVNLGFANLIGVNLTDVDLTGADLTGADLSGDEVNGADFAGARVCDAILPQGGIGGGC